MQEQLNCLDLGGCSFELLKVRLRSPKSNEYLIVVGNRSVQTLKDSFVRNPEKPLSTLPSVPLVWVVLESWAAESKIDEDKANNDDASVRTCVQTHHCLIGMWQKESSFFTYSFKKWFCCLWRFPVMAPLHFFGEIWFSHCIDPGSVGLD